MRTLPRAHERGIVLIVALVVLVAMSLAVVGLMRSVAGGNRVVGNLAFQQAATQAADVGIETAIAWLEANRNALSNDGVGTGYRSAFNPPPVAGALDTWWTTNFVNTNRLVTLPTDAQGNTVSYGIERLCSQANMSATAAGQNCSVAPNAVGNNDGSMSNVPKFNAVPQNYYRITARVAGPRNTVSYVQAIVSM